MGLDLYVGQLTRYHVGDWKTIIQQSSREQGMKCEIIRSGPEPEDAIKDKAVVGEAVRNWMTALSNGLSTDLTSPLVWDETGDLPYFTDKPDWVGYAGLVLWAAYQEHPGLKKPKRAVTEWNKEKAWKESTEEGFKSKYAQILLPEFWLPNDFNFLFTAEDAVGNEVMFGSSFGLLEQLRQLNEETFRGSEEDFARWKYDGAGKEDSFERSSKFGLALFTCLAELSVKNRLPMKLDY